ncbi:MAG: glycosyltransferase family 8 protein [Clostridia bacterium]|nr:glycosyltransferase family 8 protein [Clostridia bacterium]
MKINEEIPIFFSSDDNYASCLSVAIKSLEENSNKDKSYRVIVLTSSMNEENRKEIKSLETKNVRIDFEDVSSSLEKIDKELKLRLRDYYSIAIFYRLFIPNLFPYYEKAIYLDADMVILDDVAKLYEMEMDNNMLIATTDMVVNESESFCKYSKVALGLEPEKYINSGMLVMNLREMRKEKIEQKFIYLLLKYNMEVIAPDQDYLNLLCKDRIKYIEENWDKMPDFGKDYDVKDLHIIHFNMMRKPWHYEEVPYSDVFWEYAKKTNYYDVLKKELENYSKEQKQADMQGVVNLTNLSNKIIGNDIQLIDVVHETNAITEDSDFNAYEVLNIEGLLI